jgi:DNA-binding NarL/FixJ family response regulator
MTPTGQRVLSTLTPKEREVLVKLCEGKTNPQIGAEMMTSTQVVKNYLKHVFEEAGMDNRMELMLFSFRHGIVECPCGVKK